MLIIGGIIFVLIGIFCFLSPLHAYVNLVRYSGIIILAGGIVLQFASSYAHTSFAREKSGMRIESILDLIFGIILIFNPFMTFILFPFVIGWWILLKGIIKIIISLSLRKQIGGWLFILFTGILSLVFALLIIYAPQNKADDIIKVIGAFFICMGIVFIYDSVKLRRMHETINLLF
jgi:uncharacterized membrane protein HdeD (DUF308 family)